MKEKNFTLHTELKQNRQNFCKGMLLEQNCSANPFDQFKTWLSDAVETEDPYANVMTLCTLDEHGMPDSRTVLLRNISYSGFTFYTNYDSAKGKQMAQHAKVCLLFFWKELERQVKIQGEVRFLPQGESDSYFASRPFESQVGAWASQQSGIVKDRKTLDERYEQELSKYKEKHVPRPEHWGGYVVLPSSIEFWQGRASRLHDRIRYTLQANKSWKLERLMP